MTEYWEKRNKELLKIQLIRAEYLHDMLIEEYEATQISLQKKLIEFYDKLDEVTIKEARKLLSPVQLRDFKRNINYYLTDDIREIWRKELTKLKGRSRISRLEGMLVDVEHELERLGKIENKSLEELVEKSYFDSYYRELFEISKSIGYSRVFDRIDTRKVNLLIEKGWAEDSKNISERIWGRNTKINNYLKKHLVQSLKMGEDPIHMINKTSKRFNKSKFESGRLIMTESAYYTSHAQEDAYRELDVERYQIIATLDDRTSDICIDMDLEIFEMSEYDVGITAPPFHPMCRTVTIPYFDDQKLVRVARGEDDWYEVEGDISYTEWRDNYIR